MKWYVEIKSLNGVIPFLINGNSVCLLKQTDSSDIREETREFARNEGGIYIPSRLNVLETQYR